MDELTVGDTVLIVGKTMNGKVARIISTDGRGIALVLVRNVMQIYFPMDQLLKLEV